MKKLWQNIFENEFKHRITLILIGFLALNTLCLLYIVLNLHDSQGNKIAFGKGAAETTASDKGGGTGGGGKNPPASAVPSASPGGGGGSTPSPSPVSVSPPIVIGNEPYPGAPPCADSGDNHDTSKFHTLWDSERRCHYDHEHGENPFTPEVAAAFPNLDLFALLGRVQIGHTNPSGPMENTHKHGGFKWQVQTTTPNGCALGFENAEVAINGIAMQYHGFGNYAIEFDSRVHSALALMRQCLPGSTDYGYVYTVQHIDYGQRVSGYQGDIIPYEDTPNPAYGDALAPYFTIDCIGRAAPPCGRYTTYQQYRAANGNTSSTWTSKNANRIAPSGSSLLTLLFRVHDTYQILDWSDQFYPFKFLWMCSGDGGNTYSASQGCRYNNSTTRVHEIAGTIPSSWDNRNGFDTNSRVGRITASGFTTRFGTLNTNCTTAGPDCHPIRLVNAYVGRYGSLLIQDKVVSFSTDTLPERDVYFCDGRVCAFTDPGAVSSGWIGPNN